MSLFRSSVNRPRNTFQHFCATSLSVPHPIMHRWIPAMMHQTICFFATASNNSDRRKQQKSRYPLYEKVRRDSDSAPEYKISTRPIASTNLGPACHPDGSTILVVVESPNKCSHIQKYLWPVIQTMNQDRKRTPGAPLLSLSVVATVGHFLEVKDVELVRPYHVSWVLASSEVPNPSAHRPPAIDTLRQMCARPEQLYEVVLATDPDREGELIAAHVHETLIRPRAIPFSRAYFTAITESVVQEGFQKRIPRYLHHPLVDAALTRHAVDRVFGFIASRLLSTVHPECRSLGRVQTPALILLRQREDQLRAYEARSSVERFSLEPMVSLRVSGSKNVLVAVPNPKWITASTTRGSGRGKAKASKSTVPPDPTHVGDQGIARIAPFYRKQTQAKEVAEKLSQLFLCRIIAPNSSGAGTSTTMTSSENSSQEGKRCPQEDAGTRPNPPHLSLRFDIAAPQRRRVAPRPPYTMVSLLADAGKKLKMSGEETSSLLQALFVEGLVTYPRTDSTRMSPEFVESFHKQFLVSFLDPLMYKKIQSNNSCPSENTPHKNASASQVAEGAHEAIRPTSMNRIPSQFQQHTFASKTKWSNRHCVLYALIWTRALISQMPHQEFTTLTSTIRVKHTEEDSNWMNQSLGITFTTSAVTQEGWRDPKLQEIIRTATTSTAMENVFGNPDTAASMDLTRKESMQDTAGRPAGTHQTSTDSREQDNEENADAADIPSCSADTLLHKFLLERYLKGSPDSNGVVTISCTLITDDSTHTSPRPTEHAHESSISDDAVGVCVSGIRMLRKVDAPPRLYTEGTLIQELKDLGIGRPSTYPSMLSKLQERNYVTYVDANRTLSITDVGTRAVQFAQRVMHSFVDVRYTGQLEDQLNAIAVGVGPKKSMKNASNRKRSLVNASTNRRAEPIVEEKNEDVDEEEPVEPTPDQGNESSSIEGQKRALRGSQVIQAFWKSLDRSVASSGLIFLPIPKQANGQQMMGVLKSLRNVLPLMRVVAKPGGVDKRVSGSPSQHSGVCNEHTEVKRKGHERW